MRRGSRVRHEPTGRTGTVLQVINNTGVEVLFDNNPLQEVVNWRELLVIV